MKKTTIGEKKKQLASSIMQRATKRLMRDLLQIQKEPLPGVAAAPLEKNIFLWHCNVKGPEGTPWEGGIFHMILTFPHTYPDSPPTLQLCTRINHPNVNGDRVCLNLLEERQPAAKGNNKFEGWSSSYTVQTILVQLQAFLFEAEVSKVLADISDIKQYEQKKKEWLSGVKFSVEQSRNYNDNSCNHHPPRAPWPKFPDEKELDKAAKDFSALSKTDLIKSELLCFFTRQSFEEDVLGVGLTFSKNVRTGEIKSIQSPLDLVSLRAFMNHELRQSSTNEKFTHWLPLYLSPKHGEKAMYLAKRSISIICTGTNKNFKPEMVLNVIPRLMSTMVVEVMTGKVHASIKALRGYCFFHRLLLQFFKEYPELQQMCNEQVANFLKEDKFRHKDVVPNLGEFLCLLAISKYKWQDIIEAYLDESFVRNVFWILNRYPELETEAHKEITDVDRLKYSFEVSKVSQKLSLFHNFFLNTVAQPQGQSCDDIAKAYDANYGRPTDVIEDAFSKATEKINKLASYQEFFESIGKKLTDVEILGIITSSIKRSKDKGYHGTNLSVLTPEEFAKENRAVDFSKLTVKDSQGNTSLIDDEKTWQGMCNKRWGSDDVPEYLKTASNPWRKLYLQLNIQDLVGKLNESQDFKAFHDTLDLSTEIPRLELVAFNPTNIKSKYFFITSIMIKLKNLDTLIVRKGETGLGVKGFKALIKGLSKNPGCLKTLILEHCDIDAKSIEELTKGTLVSSNLSSLILVGNPLGDQGATNLSKFLLRHQNLPHLTELDLTDCQISTSGANAIAEALLVKKELKVLKLQNNPCHGGMTSILRNLAYNPSIKEINAAKMNGSMDDQGRESLGKLFRLSVSLEKLNLWRVTSVANSANEVFDDLKDNRTLKDLDLGDTGFNKMEVLGKAFTKNTSLENVNLSGNSITSTKLFNMMDEIKKANRTKEQNEKKAATTTSNDDTTLTDMQELLALKAHVRTLILNKNNLGSADKPKHKASIGELTLISKNLTILELGECGLTRDHMISLGEALKTHTSLKTLNLRRNKLGKHGLKPLISGLQENKVLEKIDLSGNELGVLGAGSLATILEKNTSLKDVNVFSNFVEIEGAELLCGALQKNTSVTTFDLGLNRIRARGAEAVVKLLEKNKTLQRFSLKHNHITDAVAMKIVMAVVNHKDCQIQYLAFAGNYLSIPIRSEIATLLNRTGRGIIFDLAKLVEVKDPEKQERTIYVTPLPMNVTETMVKGLFYENKCGVCLDVQVHKHKRRENFGKAKYCFVQFAHVDSVQLALRLQAKKLNRIAGNAVTIQRAGIQLDSQTDEEKKEANRPAARGGRGGRGGRGASRGARGGRGRGGFGRGRGGNRGRRGRRN